MGAYKKHWATASSKKAACGRRKANVITTVRPGEVTCSLCLRVGRDEIGPMCSCGHPSRNHRSESGSCKVFVVRKGASCGCEGFSES